MVWGVWCKVNGKVYACLEVVCISVGLLTTGQTPGVSHNEITKVVRSAHKSPPAGAEYALTSCRRNTRQVGQGGVIRVLPELILLPVSAVKHGQANSCNRYEILRNNVYIKDYYNQQI